jgi:hypothetical protein
MRWSRLDRWERVISPADPPGPSLGPLPTGTQAGADHAPDRDRWERVVTAGSAAVRRHPSPGSRPAPMRWTAGSVLSLQDRRSPPAPPLGVVSCAHSVCLSHWQSGRPAGHGAMSAPLVQSAPPAHLESAPGWALSVSQVSRSHHWHRGPWPALFSPLMGRASGPASAPSGRTRIVTPRASGPGAPPLTGLLVPTHAARAGGSSRDGSR